MSAPPAGRGGSGIADVLLLAWALGITLAWFADRAGYFARAFAAWVQ